MKTIGFPISLKENEKRRALLPEDVDMLDENIRHLIYVESGYGDVMDISDEAYLNKGINVVSRDRVLDCDIICDPKIGDAEYLSELKSGQTIFGWVHAVQNRDITDKILDAGLTAVCWEDMYYKGRHTFWRNNEIAGEAAIMHACCIHGVFPYETRVALLGNGNVARGAYRILTSLGAEVVQYSRRTEHLFRDEIGNYDVIVNGILWDVHRKDHIIYRDDLKRMRRGAMIIDISCDRNGGVETSVPTTIENPTYIVDGILHYVVDHTPSLFFRTISRSLSKIVSERIERLINEDYDDELNNAIAVKNGMIVDPRINEFQGR